MNTQTVAFIFDMDDTIARTGPVWRAAECALLDRIGARWSEELSLQYKGMNALDVAATIHRLLAPPAELSECQRIIREALLDGFRAGRATETAGAVACVRRMARLGPAALAAVDTVYVVLLPSLRSKRVPRLSCHWSLNFSVSNA